MALAASLLNEPVASDLERRAARWKTVSMPFDTHALTPRERRLVLALVDACRDLENIYWRQVDPEDIATYNTLARSSDPRDQLVRRLLWIHGGRWDLLDGNRPFLGARRMPPGAALYPADATRAEIDAWVSRNPERRDAIYSERTVVVRKDGGFDAIPYRTAYRRWLEPAAVRLRQAAELSSDRAFARYLRARANALGTDDYWESDVAWVRLARPKFDLIFAPYETYNDELLGVKATYGAAVLVRNETESRRVERFQELVPRVQEALPLPAEDRPSLAGHSAPMEVVDAPFRSGDLRHGYQAVADNLPNDPRIHEKVGSKRIFFKNFMDARVEHVILPLARRLLAPAEAGRVTAEGYFVDTAMHEIAHGLGPAFARKSGGRVSIREAMGPAFSGLEEAKADVVGLFALEWLVSRGAMPRETFEQALAAHVADIFRTVRFGAAEAHARAEMMEFNVFAEGGVIVPAGGDGADRYAIDSSRAPAALAALAKELLEEEASGDRARAEAWFAKYEAMPSGLRRALAAADDVPVDIDPRVPFPEGVR